MSTSEDRALIQEIEDHAATVNAHLDTLNAGLRNAKRAGDRELMRSLHADILYYTDVLTDLKKRRATIARRMGSNK